MNSSDQTPEEIQDEKRIAAALAASETNAAPPDPEVLARLRAQSTGAFLAASRQSVSMGWRQRLLHSRRARWLSAAAALVVAALGLYFWFGFGSQSQAVQLGKILENSENADTLHAQLFVGDRKFEFWHTSQPMRSRSDDFSGKYIIADETTLWTINENTNEINKKKLPPDIRRPMHFFVDLLMDLPAYLVSDLPPRERIREGELDLLIYRAEFTIPDGMVWFEARADAQSHRLISMRSWRKKAGKSETIGELTVLAYNEPIGLDKFAIADTLTEDGRIGKVTDVQGIVTIKPILHERWTPVRETLILRPGDWLRTDARGANAAGLRLMKQTGVILAPHTLVELMGPKKLRLMEGEIEITAAAGTTIELLGPGGQELAVKGRKIFRIEKQKLVQVEKEPGWLTGFKGTTANDVLGSLVALVDGRNVPLSVGYHKVTVDIRDQIARTVIEESFVNHTDAQLEGVFSFPLPADASISGFGMWIGNNLIEADIVEKQRAREIYETMRHERRDPGLLEWSGGNLFKARVFPIFAHSEKRIKITYTQVLPVKGSRFRYSYALQSEMLQQHPLRELAIDVKLHSVVPLKSVMSTTHPSRSEVTAHSAHVEFAAQEYAPTRDFEVDVELESKQADVVMIPHRRGDDGYFLLQLTPPGAPGDWDRSLLPNGESMQLLILADTSASIDAGQRATQATFIGALLAALGPKDAFNLATCDVICNWAFPKLTEADPKNVAMARDFLAKRSSLGWTNLDATFAAALKQCGPKTHVIYVGDGIVTTGDADPVAFTKRLRRLYQDQTGTFHAVSLGSSFEPAVLKAIASLGGGSMRKISSEQGPAAVARELLGDIAQPALRDIKVEFKGIKVARLYPEVLANIPAGTQQILLGRYLPEGRDQTGEIVITGTQNGKPVRFSTRASLKDAEQGNSFIPRLWARMHLDSLLDQGLSEAIKDEIIALSEEFQIITPYTSLLVLETDADRERFKVKRRFQMRDGERFFAEGRDNAVFDLAQKQMKLAGAWLTALREAVLKELAALGRDGGLLESVHSGYAIADRAAPREILKVSPPYGGFPGNGKLSYLGDNAIREIPWLDGFAAPLSVEIQGRGNDLWRRFWPADSTATPVSSLAGSLLGGGTQDIQEQIIDLLAPANLANVLGFDLNLPANPFYPELGVAVIRGKLDERYRDSKGSFFDISTSDFQTNAPNLPIFLGGDVRNAPSNWGWISGPWLKTLFPALPTARRQIKTPKSNWPAAALDLVKSLQRQEQLAKLTGAVEILRQSDTFDARRNELTARSRRLELFSAKSWLIRSEIDGAPTLISWCDGQDIAVFTRAFQLGLQRAAKLFDVQPPPLELGDFSLDSLAVDYRAWTPTLEPKGKDRTLLVLRDASRPLEELRILIDTDRHVILSIEQLHKGKTTSTVQFSDFVEAVGGWWAQRIETTDENGKRIALITQTVRTLAAGKFDEQMKQELAARAKVQFLHLPAPGVLEAKKALAAGKAGFEDHFVLMLYWHRSERWDRVLDHLQHMEKLAGDKPGLRWLRSALLGDSRRHDELRQRYLQEAVRLSKEMPADVYLLAEYVVGQARGILEASEMLTLLDELKPVYDNQPPQFYARQNWQQLRITNLSDAGRSDESLALQKQLAVDYPRDVQVQHEYARALANSGDYAAAYAWLTRVLVKEAKWAEDEEEMLRNTWTRLLREQGRYEDLVTYLAGWTEQNPAGESAYAQFLSALIMTDQIEKAQALALLWAKEGQVEGELPPPVQGRLNAAINLMLGRGQGLNTNRMDERWLAPLCQVILFFARHETEASIAENIMRQHQFTSTEEAQKLRKTLAGILIAEVDKLPVNQIQRLVNWVRSDDAEPAAWERCSAKLRQRWLNEPTADQKHALGQVTVRILSFQNRPTEVLAFLREELKVGPEEHAAEYARELFDQLLQQSWTADIEGEALGLLEKLSDHEEADQRLFDSVAALHRLTDSLLQGRIAAGTKAIVHAEKLTRTELQKKQQEIGRLAREGLADRLRQEAANHPKALGQWLIAESNFLNVTLDRNLPQTATDAWQILGAAPLPMSDQEPTLERGLEYVLRNRHVVTLVNLAARKNAEPALVKRLVEYFDKQIDTESSEGRWKLAKSSLLIVLDRSKELETSLRQWAKQDPADSRWRTALGRLLAEQGRLPEAVQQFEAVETDDELSPEDYKALSGWYLVQNQRDKHDRAAALVYKTTPESQLGGLLSEELHPWFSRGGRLPTELNPEVLPMFKVLFDKSTTPQVYLHHLQVFYQACHDFRLLASLPDAVVGHSAGRVYPFLQGMQLVLGEVRDEATADEIVKRIAEVRLRARTAVDQRALDLLEALVERRAAELQNQPGPHGKKAVAALVRAFKGTWEPGEPALMADFLANLGKIAQPALAAEQLRQLQALQAAAATGSSDRLRIARRLALTLNSYPRRADAIDAMQAGLDEFQAANAGVLPVSANDALRDFIDLLAEAGHFARAEKVLLVQIDHAVHAQQRIGLKDQLNRLYHRALREDGSVILGNGDTLHRALEAKLLKDLAGTAQDYRYQTLSLLCEVYRTAHGKKLPGALADLKTLAFKVVPPLLRQQVNNYDSTVNAVAQTVHDLAGAQEGIAFLVNQIETEPRWLRYSNQDGWTRHGNQLSQWRVEAKDLGDVEGRLLKLVLTELRRNLEVREHANREIYYQRGSSGFWKEKAADFARTAEEVLTKHSQSPAAVLHIADYFYSGLGQHKRAIEVLFTAHNQKNLGEEGQARLINYLHWQDRFGESIALLQPLVERQPENMHYRVQLMHAYFRTARNAELQALLGQTDAFFHEQDRWGEWPLWSEWPLRQLAESTLDNELFEKAVGYFKELIPVHERTQPNRGIGDGSLSGYYSSLAKAYVGLKKTPEAVEAAGAAVVAWGPHRDQRTAALETLKDVLVKSPDLDGFVAHFDKEKQDSAIVRKALGLAYGEKKEFAKAIKQLELAAQLQPNDMDIYQRLVAFYDALGDKEGAQRELLQAAGQARRDLKLYQELGQRYLALGQPDEAERAYTSIVEMLPTEPESHALLAEIREKQNRWSEAMFHWEQVARLSSLEPTGLLKLAAAQIHEKHWDDARATLRKLDSRSWPPRFGDVPSQIRKLEEQIGKKGR